MQNKTKFVYLRKNDFILLYHYIKNKKRNRESICGTGGVEFIHDAEGLERALRMLIHHCGDMHMDDFHVERFENRRVENKRNGMSEKGNNMNFNGIVSAVICFVCIGAFHPIVIKAEYYLSAKCWPLFLTAGIAALAVSLAVKNTYLSLLFGILGCSCFWSIKELFEQQERVRKGWYPRNPKRK